MKPSRGSEVGKGRTGCQRRVRLAKECDSWQRRERLAKEGDVGKGRTGCQNKEEAGKGG